MDLGEKGKRHVNQILLFQSSVEYQDNHKTVITLLPLLVASLQKEEQNDLLDAVLKHSNSEMLHISLCKGFAQLGCAIFRCLTTSFDATKFPPTFQGSCCSLCDSEDKSSEVVGRFKIYITYNYHKVHRSIVESKFYFSLL
jgi:hypothetical protein